MIHHRRDAYRYAIQFDPIPLLLNPISSYGHVDEKIEIPDLLGKHKIEYYIIVLVRNRSKKNLFDIYYNFIEKKAGPVVILCILRFRKIKWRIFDQNLDGFG